MNAEPQSQAGGERLNRLWLLAALCLVLGVAGWLWHACEQKDEIRFLPRFAGAEWVIYPKPLNPFLQGVAEVPAVFRREVTLESVPASATLKLRACRRCVVSINGQAVALPSTGEHWRQLFQVDVSRWLRAGSNRVEVTVFNPAGPPALWAVLAGPGLQVATDSAWRASYGGSVWRPAQLAARPLDGQKREKSLKAETPRAAFVQHWPLVALWFVLAVGVVWGGRWWVETGSVRVPARWAWTRDPARLTLAALAVFWVVLFAHNVGLVPATAGFDADGHLNYLKYLQEHGRLPTAGQGWEAHQPPLYYLVCAGALKCFGLGAESFDGLVLVRCVGLGIGLLHLAILFFILRLLFAERPLAQAAGLLVAGLLPMQLYMAQYISNESLAACLMSATALCLLALLRGAGTDWRWHAAAGVCLGLALLSKTTAVILVPFFGAVLLHRVVSSGAREPKSWGLAALAVAACLAVCGWHYGKVWHESGNPLFLANTDRPWWQDPGYHTAAFFTRFGRALTDPMYSGAASFGDGMYSSCWGDGWRSGGPWNFQLMALGFWLALVPTALLAAGLWVGVKLVRRANPSWIFVLSFGAVVLEAVVYFNVGSASIGAVKAVYGLGALSVLALMAASGWEGLGHRMAWVRQPVAVGLLVWGMNSFASHWILQNDPATQTLLSRSLSRSGNSPGAVAHAAAALSVDPQNVGASITLADLLARQGRLGEAVDLVSRAVKAHPQDPKGYQVLAALEKQQGRLGAAVETLQRVTELSPDDGNSRLQYATLLFQTGHPVEAIRACREALRVLPTEPEAHLLLACALEAEAAQPGVSRELAGDEPLSVPLSHATPNELVLAGAIQHFRLTLKLAPESSDVMRRLAWILATCPRAELRNGQEAMTWAKRACDLTGKPDAQMLATLAAAQAEAGQFAQALQTAEQAQERAGKAGGLSQQLGRMLGCFGQHQPYHQVALRREAKAE